MPIKLSDILTKDDLNDESEKVYHYISEEDLSNSYDIMDIFPEDFVKLTVDGFSSVIEVFEDFASADQVDIVEQKRADFDEDRIILLFEDVVIDGNHHLMAAFFENRPVRAIDISSPVKLENTMPMSEPS